MTLLLRSERQRYAVRPPEPVLRRVLSAARAPRHVGNVVLFRNLARRPIGLPVQGQPTAAGGSGQVSAAVAANSLARPPFQGRPYVGGVPLLTRGDERRYEPAGPQEVSLQPGSYRPTLLGGGEPKVERGGGGDRSPVRDALAAPPTDVVEEPGVGIICRREQGPATVLGRVQELFGDLRVTSPPAERPQRRDHPLGVIEQAVEVHRHQVGRFQCPQIPRVTHPAAREVPAAFGRGL